MLDCAQCIHVSVCKFANDAFPMLVEERSKETPFKVKMTCSKFMAKKIVIDRNGEFKSLKEILGGDKNE